MIDNLRLLTQEQRQGARKQAREAVIRAIGPRPREHFNQSAISKYQPSVTRLIFLLCLVLLLAAFTPSAIRLYVIGSQTFRQAVSSSAAQTAVGLATVLSAEVGQVVFSLALATLGTSQSARRLLMISMMIATTIALVGNVQISLPGHTDSPFAWLESIAPPLLVLSTAYVMKEQILEAVEIRHANERAFQVALAEWQTTIATPEDFSTWMQFYANTLQGALRKANARRKETLGQMTVEDWRLAGGREMRADMWYQNAEPDNGSSLSFSHAVEAITANSNGNGTRPKVSAAPV
jgi:hypothetical protein